MPYEWVRISASPPLRRRDQVRKIVEEDFDAKLDGDQIYFPDAEGTAYALIKIPKGFRKRRELLDALGARDNVSLLDADEKAREEGAAS